MTAPETPRRSIESAPDVLCAGIIVADHVCRPVPALPPPGGLVLTDGMEMTIGGCAANVAVDFARLGHNVAVAGRIGDDVLGHHTAGSLQAAGIDCGNVTFSTSRETACTVVINVAGEDRRFIHTLGANAEFTGENLNEDQIARTRMLYIGGYGLVESLSPEDVSRLFATARTHNVMTVLDVVLAEPRDYGKWFKPVLPLTDIFLPNTDEARLLIDERDPLRQAERFHRDGAATAVVTSGPEGAVLVSEEAVLRAAAYDVETIDGTGSGDAFLAGFVHARLKGDDAQTCLRYGSAAGACCVQHPGATTGIPTAEDLQRTVREHPLAVEML